MGSPHPTYSPRDFGEAAQQLQCHPSCKVCGGRGYDGIVKMPDGTLKLSKCVHATWGETDFVKMIKRVDEVIGGVTVMEAHFIRRLDDMSLALQILLNETQKPWYKKIFKRSVMTEPYTSPQGDLVTTE